MSRCSRHFWLEFSRDHMDPNCPTSGSVLQCLAKILTSAEITAGKLAFIRMCHRNGGRQRQMPPILSVFRVFQLPASANGSGTELFRLLLATVCAACLYMQQPTPEARGNQTSKSHFEWSQGAFCGRPERRQETQKQSMVAVVQQLACQEE